MTAALGSQRGFALITTLLVMLVLFVLAMALMLESRTEHLVAANEHDHLAALGYAEAGLTWAERRFADAISVTSLLLGPDGTTNTADDNLFGLRSLSLTSTAQLNGTNEDTASAIVTRDFGGLGSMTWEAFRIDAGANTRALVYVRIDDNFDDDRDDPTNNVPLADKDRRAWVRVVAEYPVFVDANGVEQAPPLDRGRARRTIVATFDQGGLSLPAISSNADIELGGNLCGECGSAHANGDINVASGADICGDATATGSFSGSSSSVAGDASGGNPALPLPIINPYDDRYVPTIDTFDTSSDAVMPPGLRCPKATAADPGASKYFAMVSGAGSKGEVWKAYWDFTNKRWTWRLIDNLEDVTDVVLDDCGRVQGDPQFGAGAAGAVSDGSKSEFYGFSGTKWSAKGCANCGGAGGDASLCGLTDNDFNPVGHYPAGGGPLVASPTFPGSYQPDGNGDFNPTQLANSMWNFGSKQVYSPLHGAVIWVRGGMLVMGNAGEGSPADFRCSAGAGCNPVVIPHGAWRCSIVALGDIVLQGSANIAPANSDAASRYLLVSGRDISISGNAQEDSGGCPGTCPTTTAVDVEEISGIYAAHEQVGTSGNPNIFGFMLAEEAMDCSNGVTAPTKVNGTPQIYYDCLHPPNPWSTGGSQEPIFWHEVE
jgi:Tfp pilus assembly protein PilX